MITEKESTKILSIESSNVMEERDFGVLLIKELQYIDSINSCVYS